MVKPYSYNWFIQQFEDTKSTAEAFLLSVEEPLFIQKPSQNRWSIAECYSHLINYGDLYLTSIESTVSANKRTKKALEQTFPPRWIPAKIIRFFEPPYSLKLKTISSMKPTYSSSYTRMELMDDYLNLQDRLIGLLEKGHQNNVDLGQAKLEHPIFSILKMTLSECFLLLEAHQRRHQWQAEQTLQALKDHTT